MLFNPVLKKRFLRILILVVSYSLFAINSKANIDTVLVKDNQFAPNTITVCLGDTIRFVYDAGATNIHNVHITSPIDSTSADLTTLGDMFQFTFTTTATYSYHCDYHGDSGTVKVNTIPSVNLGADVTQCGGSITLNAGNTGLSYFWSTVATTQTIVVAASGTYYVDVTNSCGTASDTIIVTINPLPTISISANKTICIGSNATLTASGGTAYTWISGGQTTSSIIINPSVTSSYTVIGTDANGCSGIAADTINISSPLSITVSSTNATCATCPDGFASAIVSGGIAPYTYLWSGGQTTSTATGLMHGTYSVCVTDTIGCQSCASVFVGPVCDSLQTLFSGTNKENGNMFDVTAVNTVTISSFDANINDDGSGSVTMNIYYKAGTHVGFDTTASAWTFIDSVNVTPAAIGIPTHIPININLTIPAGQTFAFYVTTSTITDDLAYTNGTAVGNIFSQDANIQIKEGTGNVYPFGTIFQPRVWNGNIHYCLPAILSTAQEITKSFSIKFFPNPFSMNTTVEIQGAENKNMELTLFNIYGQQIRNFKIDSYRFDFNRDDLPSGIYFYKITDKDVSSSGKLIIQ